MIRLTPQSRPCEHCGVYVAFSPDTGMYHTIGDLRVEKPVHTCDSATMAELLWHCPKHGQVVITRAYTTVGSCPKCEGEDVSRLPPGKTVNGVFHGPKLSTLGWSCTCGATSYPCFSHCIDAEAIKGTTPIDRPFLGLSTSHAKAYGYSDPAKALHNIEPGLTKALLDQIVGEIQRKIQNVMPGVTGAPAISVLVAVRDYVNTLRPEDKPFDITKAVQSWKPCKHHVNFHFHPVILTTDKPDNIKMTVSQWRCIDCGQEMEPVFKEKEKQ